MKKIISSLILSLLMVFTLQSATDAKMVVVNQDKANVRSGPGKNYKILWSVPKYTPFEVLCKYENWYVIRDYEGDVGWVSDTRVEKDKAVIIKTKTADVRSGPGKSSDIIWKLEKGYPLKFLELKDNWVKVQDTDGGTGWTEKENVWGLSVQ
jgi:SH3-like domain-containing protein